MTGTRAVITSFIWIAWGLFHAVQAGSRIETHIVDSNAFDGNKVGASSSRAYQVYLPNGYDIGNKRYPVVYFLHSFFENETQLFEKHGVRKFFDEAIASGKLDELIIVAADYSTPVGGGFYTSSPVTGDWLKFVAEDLPSHVDANFRTLNSASSRAIWGNYVGGYGAIRIASRRPDVFGVVYAMHPVGTGHGHVLMQSRPDWESLEHTKSLDDLKANFFNQIFTIIYQANLPNSDRPPLYFDPPAKLIDGELKFDTVLTEKLQRSFFLERHIGEYSENLKSLKAFKFDWGRHDPNQDHVYSNQFYSRKLNEFGVQHEAEEYNGSWGDKMFDEGGRLETDVIPFFQQHLTFGE